MSQRKFTHGDFSVFTGWDRPLKYFFLVIERLDAKDDDPDGGMVFSNLRRKNPGMTLPEIAETLQQFKIPSPSTLMADLEQDRVENLRNHEHDYGAV